jgi:hypothetical protein
MPTEFRKIREREREPTDLERYGQWQDGVMLIGLLFLGVIVAKWLWGS